MTQLNVGKSRRHHKGAIRVGPFRGLSIDDKIGGEIIGISSRGTVVGVLAGFGRAPLQPVLGRAGNPAALEETAEAIKLSGSDRKKGVGCSILAELGDGPVVSFVHQ